MPKRDLISIHDLSNAEMAGVLRLATAIKQDQESHRTALAGQSLAMIFQKSSTRTRVSFEVGMTQLGGTALFLSSGDLQLGRGETIADTARVLSRYVHGIMARTFAHQDVLDLAAYGTVPVINGLTDDLHPCQGLADYLTLCEIFAPAWLDGGGAGGPPLAGRRITYVGDGNNVAHSLMFGAARMGMEIVVATPPGFEPRSDLVEQARGDAAEAGSIQVTNDPAEAAAGASAVYTDVWASMGQEEEARERLRAFAGYAVDEALMARARPDAVFFHCLPAHRGEEVTAAVADGAQSRILDQAENRLHAQKALMAWLMGGYELPAA
ncbi:MAG: ornithine carbamoyltransferase [Thermoanaerobaculia bacterium]